MRELAGADGSIPFGDAREVELKGLAGVHRVHSVDWTNAASAGPMRDLGLSRRVASRRMETERANPMRVLAPAAIVVFALALLLVIATSGGESEPQTASEKKADKARDLGAPKKTKTTGHDRDHAERLVGVVLRGQDR